MKAKELQAMSVEDLLQKEKSLKKDLFDLRYQRRIGRVERPSQFKLIKRDIARILTILRERERNGNKG
jgi:large subunit ribosomal protein L29